MKCHIKHFSQLVVKSDSVFHHINCFSGHTFTTKDQLASLQATVYVRKYQCIMYISIFWWHKSRWHYRFPYVRKPWHHWQIMVNAASNSQSAANAITYTLLSHRKKLVHIIYEILFIPNSSPKNLCLAYSRETRYIRTQKMQLWNMVIRHESWRPLKDCKHHKLCFYDF
jgi:hypothetical protein